MKLKNLKAHNKKLKLNQSGEKSELEEETSIKVISESQDSEHEGDVSTDNFTVSLLHNAINP